MTGARRIKRPIYPTREIPLHLNAEESESAPDLIRERECKPMNHIKAIIFDFDGLILDTETTDYQAWQSLYRKHGLELPVSTWLPSVGNTTIEFNFDQEIAELTGNQIDRIEVRKQQKTIHLDMLEGVDPMPGVEDYLCAAERLGIRVGVASGSRRWWVVERLDQIGLLDRFETIVCRDDVGERAKPDPAAYVTAVSNLGVTVDQAFALEDSLTGVAAAKSAGLYCVAVPGPMTKHMSFIDADMRLESLADMPLPELLETLQIS